MRVAEVQDQHTVFLADIKDAPLVPKRGSTTASVLVDRIRIDYRRVNYSLYTPSRVLLTGKHVTAKSVTEHDSSEDFFTGELHQLPEWVGKLVDLYSPLRNDECPI